MNGLTRRLPTLDIGTLFEGCEAAGLRAGLAPPISRTVLLPAHAALFRSGEAAQAVFTLEQGTVKLLRRQPDGRQQVIGFRAPGDLIGYTGRDRYGYDAEVITDARLRRHDRERFEAASRRWLVLSHRLLAYCGAELAAAQDQLGVLSHRSAEGRVASFLLMLRAAAQREGANGLRLRMATTREDIGDYLGLTTESVSRVFAALRRTGVLVVPMRGILLLADPVALEAMAGLDGATYRMAVTSNTTSSCISA